MTRTRNAQKQHAEITWNVVNSKSRPPSSFVSFIRMFCRLIKRLPDKIPLCGYGSCKRYLKPTEITEKLFGNEVEYHLKQVQNFRGPQTKEILLPCSRGIFMVWMPLPFPPTTSRHFLPIVSLISNAIVSFFSLFSSCRDRCSAGALRFCTPFSSCLPTHFYLRTLRLLYVKVALLWVSYTSSFLLGVFCLPLSIFFVIVTAHSV